MNWRGKKLNVLCEKAGFSPSALAERMGVSRPTVYSWFSGRDPRGSQLLRLSELLRVEPQELYDRETGNLKRDDIGSKLASGNPTRGTGRLSKFLKTIFVYFCDFRG
ncbi:MAG: helix-turn-helix transcriptional regulator [Kiritimatiellae bacterium]|jgi:transcriptional regulator with XRE-family HTH domain|nr:helix-turn-helix transcriptional regulator [Kiritimatiellia bacterium]